MARFKHAEKTAWKVIADPTAPETSWLPACQVVAGEQALSSVAENRPALATAIAPILALVVALFAAAGGQTVVQCGFDWGYYLTDAIREQSPSSQGIVAAIVLSVFVPPVIFSVFAGQLGAIFHQHNKWFRLTPVFGTLAYFCWAISLSDSPGAIDADALRQMGTYCAISMILASASYLVSNRFSTWLRSMSKTSAVVLVPAMLCAGVSAAHFFGFSINSLSEKWGEELALYMAFITALSFAGAYVSRAKRVLTASLYSLSAVMPILVVVMMNVAGTIVSIGLDSVGLGAKLGPGACVSAILIATGTMLSVAGGGFAAARLRQSQNPTV